MLGPAGGVTRLCRAVAPHPSVRCWHIAPTAQQPGKPCKGEGATEAPGSCCVSQEMQMGSVRQRRKSRDWQLLCCAGTCQPADGPLQGLGTSWQRQERRRLYFSMASQGTITFLWLFYLSWAHHKKVLHFANLCVCTAEHEPPLWKITAGRKQHYTSQQLQLQ